MKKYGKDILFCGLLCLGSYVIPLLMGWLVEAITGSSDIGGNVMCILLAVFGVFSVVFSVFKGKNFLIYPVVNLVATFFMAVMAGISVVTDLGNTEVVTDGTDLETILSIVSSAFSSGLIVILIIAAVVFATVAFLQTFLMSFIAKRLYDKMNGRTSEQMEGQE